MSLEKYSAIIDKTELAAITKNNYKDRLKRLTELIGRDVFWILTNPEPSWEKVKGTIKSAETAKSYLTTILTMYKHDPNLKVLFKQCHEQWFDLFEQVVEMIEEKHTKMEPSERQIETYMEWDDIIKGRDTYTNRVFFNQTYLLICLMTMIPPCRADLNKVKIYLDREPSDDEKVNEPNYLMIWSKPQKMTLMYHEFKTKCDWRPFYKKDLPVNLMEVISASLKNKPRDYLIVSPRSGLPYDNVQSYISYFKKQTLQVYGRDISINVFRHSYIIYYCKLHPSYAKRKELAIDMMNSVKTLQRYQYEPEYLKQ